MLEKLYAKWMYAWETALTTRDTNRIVRPLEWGEDWLEEFVSGASLGDAAMDGREADSSAALRNDKENGSFERMMRLNESLVGHSEEFFGYETPTDYRLEMRHPQLFPTNVRPETLEQAAEWKRLEETGEGVEAEFLRFTSPMRTRYPENDIVNARWYPASPERQAGKPKQAIIVMPQWNADAFSHNALCTLFNRFGISALRLSKPYHDIRRPAELERSDYAVSSNVGRTIAACRQAVIDIRCCIDWLESQGYEHFGVLGTSLGSCYAFIAAAFDPRIQSVTLDGMLASYQSIIDTRLHRQVFEQVVPGAIRHYDLDDLAKAIAPRPVTIRGSVDAMGAAK